MSMTYDCIHHITQVGYQTDLAVITQNFMFYRKLFCTLNTQNNLLYPQGYSNLHNKTKNGVEWILIEVVNMLR